VHTVSTGRCDRHVKTVLQLTFTFGNTLRLTVNVKKKKCKAVPALNEALRHEGVLGSGCIDPGFLDLGSSWS
jgi:hypothetical protein